MAIGAGLLTLHAVETIVSAFEQKGVAAFMVTCYITSLPDAVTTE